MVAVIAFIAMASMMLLTTQQKGAPENLLELFSYAIVITAVVITLALALAARLKTRLAKRLRYVIEDDTISIMVASSSPSGESLKLINGKFNLNNIRSINDREGDLTVTFTSTNQVVGKRVLMIPAELEEFGEIKRMLESKRN